MLHSPNTKPDFPPQHHRSASASHIMYNTAQNTGYRGTAPAIQPYAFQSTPQQRRRSASATPPSSTPPPVVSHRPTASASTDSSDSRITAPQLPEFSFAPLDSPAPKASPGRYRRPEAKRATTVDDAVLTSVSPVSSEPAKRYRRRSRNNTVEGAAPDVESLSASAVSGAPTNAHPAPIRSVESPRPASPLGIPPRGSSDPSRRLVPPSPLSRQTEDAPAAPLSPMKHKSYAAAAQAAVSPATSAAAQQLAAVSDRDSNQGVKSRLRRAFSFGGAHELRRAAGENTAAQQQAQQAQQQHRQHIDDELDAEQLEIARRQEAAGIGAGIYSGQGGFTGSTDNLSISSTASSASMMLRKMGKGAKKGARSIKGLFRPKSVVGVPAVEPVVAPVVQPPVAQVSMVTVEAERLQVNVNAYPDQRTGGGTGFPKLERNSVDLAAAASTRSPPSTDGSDAHSARRSIVGSDLDRAEVLAAVKKGILKRAGGSPASSPAAGPPTFVATITDSPASSAPGTPPPVQTVHSLGATHPGAPGPVRSVSASHVPDYFGPAAAPPPHLLSSSRSMPPTPNGGAAGPRNISFSPRIQFHDAWSASEYDRRGEIATCNRLTPMLAQQIKEELNTFKMVSLRGLRGGWGCANELAGNGGA